MNSGFQRITCFNDDVKIREKRTCDSTARSELLTFEKVQSGAWKVRKTPDERKIWKKKVLKWKKAGPDMNYFLFRIVSK